MDKRFFYFVNEVLFKGWKNAASIPGMLGIISFILVPKMDSKWPFKYSLLIGISYIFLCYKDFNSNVFSFYGKRFNG